MDRLFSFKLLNIGRVHFTETDRKQERNTVAGKREKRAPSTKPAPNLHRTSFRQKLILVAFGLGVLVVAELALHLIPEPGASGVPGDPFVGFSRLHPLYESYRASDGSLRMRTVPDKQQWFNAEDFSAVKTPGDFRIISLGGSTTYGRPYGNTTSYSGWLERLLNRCAPAGRHYEVINAGGISYASYRVTVLLDELLAYKPDLVIIYTGHNEFLEARTYGRLLEQPASLIELRSLLNRMRLYRLLKLGLGKIRPGAEKKEPSGQTDGRSLLSPEVETLLDRSAGLDYYQRDSLFSSGVFGHFRYNVDRMIERCRRDGVSVVFCDPVDNLKDFSPFKSLHSPELSAEGQVRVEGLLGQAGKALGQNRSEEALAALTEAERLDPLYARTFFLLGRARLDNGDTLQAAGAFLAARELDICPLRAQEPIHQALREECAKEEAPLLALRPLFAARCRGGIIGSEILVDHIHPNPRGNLLIAGAIAGWMQREGLAPEYSPPDTETEDRLYRAVMDSLPGEYFSRGVLNLVKVLTWARKFEEVKAITSQQTQALEGIAEADYLRATALEADGRLEEALECYRTTLREIPWHRNSLNQAAQICERLGRLQEAEATYTQALEHYPEDVPLLANYGIFLARLGQRAQAMERLQRALELQPNSTEVLDNLGFLCILEGDYLRAHEYLKRSLEVNPVDAQAWHYLGLAHLQQGRLAEAEREFLEAVRLNPQHDSARNNLANIYLRSGRFGQAEEQLKAALLVSQQRPETWVNLCLLYRNTGRDSLFRENLAQALARFPQDPRFRKMAQGK